MTLARFLCNLKGGVDAPLRDVLQSGDQMFHDMYKRKVRECGTATNIQLFLWWGETALPDMPADADTPFRLARFDVL